MNYTTLTKRSIVIGLLALTAVSLALALGAGAATASNDYVDAERTAETTIVDPGDEVDVSITFDLDEQTHLNLVEALRPAIGELDEYELTHESDGTIVPDFVAWEANGGVLLFDDLESGEYELNYQIDIDDDVEPGSVYEFDGAVQKADDSTQERVEQFENSDFDVLDAQLLSDQNDGDSQLQVATVGEGESETLGNVTAHDPDNQSVDVDVSMGANDTEGTVSLERNDDSVVSSSVSGDTGDETTARLSLSGLSTGEFALVVESTDGSIEVDATQIETETTMNATANETVFADVEYEATEDTETTVMFEQGSESNETTIEFDPVDYEGGEGWKSAEWEAPDDGDVTVTVETDPAESQQSVETGLTSPLLGGAVGGFLGDLGAPAPADVPPWAMALGAIVMVVAVGAVIVRVN